MVQILWDLMHMGAQLNCPCSLVRVRRCLIADNITLLIILNSVIMYLEHVEIMLPKITVFSFTYLSQPKSKSLMYSNAQPLGNPWV